MCMIFTPGQKDHHPKWNCLKSGIGVEKGLSLRIKHMPGIPHLNPEVHPPQIIQKRISMEDDIQDIDQHVGRLIDHHIVLRLMTVINQDPQITGESNSVDKVHQKTDIQITKEIIGKGIK